MADGDKVRYEMVRLMNLEEEREDRRRFREVLPGDGEAYEPHWRGQMREEAECSRLWPVMLREGSLPERALVSYPESGNT